MNDQTIEELLKQVGKDFVCLTPIPAISGEVRGYLLHVKWGREFYQDQTFGGALLAAMKDKPPEPAGGKM